MKLKPTDTSLKKELVTQILKIIYDNDMEYKKYLESFSEEELDKMLGDYYLHLKPKKNFNKK